MPCEPYTDADFAAEKVLIAHERLDIGSCICGWGVDTGDLGRSHSLHVWRELQRLVLPSHDAWVREQAAQDILAHADKHAPGNGNEAQRRLRRHLGIAARVAAGHPSVREIAAALIDDIAGAHRTSPEATDA